MSKSSLPPSPALYDIVEESTQTNNTMSDATPDHQKTSTRQVSQALGKMVVMSKSKSNPNLKAKGTPKSKTNTKSKNHSKESVLERKAIEEAVANWDGQPPVVSMTFLFSPRLPPLVPVRSLVDMIGDWHSRQDSAESIASALPITPESSQSSLENVRGIGALAATHRKGLTTEMALPIEKLESIKIESPPFTDSLCESGSGSGSVPSASSASASTPISSDEVVSSPDSPASFSDSPRGFDSDSESSLYFSISENRRRPRVSSASWRLYRTRLASGVKPTFGASDVAEVASVAKSPSLKQQPSRRQVLSPPSEPIPFVTKNYNFDKPRPAPLMPAPFMADSLKLRPIKTAAYYKAKYAHNRI